MKTAIKLLERKIRLLNSRMKKKETFLGSLKFDYNDNPIRRQAKDYINKTKEDIKSLEKAIFFLNQTEQNLNGKHQSDTEDSVVIP